MTSIYDKKIEKLRKKLTKLYHQKKKLIGPELFKKIDSTTLMRHSYKDDPNVLEEESFIKEFFLKSVRRVNNKTNTLEIAIRVEFIGPIFHYEKQANDALKKIINSNKEIKSIISEAKSKLLAYEKETKDAVQNIESLLKKVKNDTTLTQRRSEKISASLLELEADTKQFYYNFTEAVIKDLNKSIDEKAGGKFNDMIRSMFGSQWTKDLKETPPELNSFSIEEYNPYKTEYKPESKSFENFVKEETSYGDDPFDIDFENLTDADIDKMIRESMTEEEESTLIEELERQYSNETESELEALKDSDKVSEFNFMDYLDKNFSKDDNKNSQSSESSKIIGSKELPNTSKTQHHSSNTNFDHYKSELNKLKKRNCEINKELIEEVGEESLKNTKPILMNERDGFIQIPGLFNDKNSPSYKAFIKELKEYDKAKSKIEIALRALITGTVFNYEEKAKKALQKIYKTDKKAALIIDKLKMKLSTFSHNSDIIFREALEISKKARKDDTINKEQKNQISLLSDEALDDSYLDFTSFKEACIAETSKELNKSIGKKFQKKLAQLGDITPGLEQKDMLNNQSHSNEFDESSDEIGFKGKKKKGKDTSSGDTSSDSPKSSSKKSFIGDNVKPNSTPDEEYTFVIDPITKKPVRKRVLKEVRPLTIEEVEKQLEKLQKFTVIIPEDDYFINTPNPDQIKQFPEYFVMNGTKNHKVFIECQKYWAQKFNELYSNSLKVVRPVKQSKQIDSQIVTKDVTKLVVLTTALAVALKKLKFKSKFRTVQSKIMQKSGMKLQSSNTKKLSSVRNVSQNKVKAKITKGGLKLTGEKAAQGNSNRTTKLNSVGKGNGRNLNRGTTRISGRPAVGRCSSWYKVKHNFRFGAAGTPLMNNGAGGAGKPEILTR